MKTRILLISDIAFQIEHFQSLFSENQCDDLCSLTVRCSPGSEAELSSSIPSIQSINVKENAVEVSESYDLIISYHCRQLFPNEVVNQVRCVNIHPGFNPYNKGWYPGVFSIYNGLPTGATIHEIDEKIDNGPIIAQQQIEILPEDTSATVYPKIINAEKNLLEKWFLSIIKGDYTTFRPTEKGNLNYKKDYYNFQRLDLYENVTIGDVINRLRALTHPPFQNAYFIDDKTGDKIFVSLSLQREDSKDG